MCLHDNILNILFKHVEQFGMNLTSIQYSKTLLKHYN